MKGLKKLKECESLRTSGKPALPRAGPICATGSARRPAGRTVQLATASALTT